MIYISNKAAEALDAYCASQGHSDPLIPAEECFNQLDEMYNLVPEQDIDGGTFEWVCNYGGGRFYTKVEQHDVKILAVDGI